MKSVLLIAALLLTSNAWADDVPTAAELAQLPATIRCTSNAVSSHAKSFTISKLDTENPEASIFDQSLMDIPAIGDDPIVSGQRAYSFEFSNECDNMYQFKFFVGDLTALKEGKVAKISGLMGYGDSELFDATNGLTQEETLVISCSL